MNLEHFRAAAKASGLTVKKLRDLEVVRVSEGNKSLVDMRYSDIFEIVRFVDWYNQKIALKLSSQ